MSNRMGEQELSLCIRYRENARNLSEQKTTIEKLCCKYPSLCQLDVDNLADSIVKAVFPDGLCKEISFRNISRPNSGKIEFILIPKRTTGDFIDNHLDAGENLFLYGHLHNGICYIDMFDVVSGSSSQDCASVYVSPRPMPDNPAFVDFISNLPSVRAESSKQLDEWRGFLQWKRRLVERQIHGAKFYAFKFDKEKECIVFFLIFSDKEKFDKEKKFLKRDMRVFTNLLSLDKWHFEYDNQLRYIDSDILGRFKGFFNERELSGKAKENPQEKHEHPRYKEENKVVVQTSEESFDEKKLSSLFQCAYLVDVVYELPDECKKDALVDDEDGNDIEEKISEFLEGIPRNGFIARSAAGEFALIRRFEEALDKLESCKSYNQNLINWIFNVKNVSLTGSAPKRIERWGNPLVGKNENQRYAVEKALAAKELFLLQGPPGTGKTTVIAEIIYQLVLNGQRVFLLSQSNDAVDNALDALKAHPAIRAIRLGQRGGQGKIKSKDEQICKYVKDTALKIYYDAVSEAVSQEHFDKWKKLDEKYEECSKDLRDVEMYSRDVQQLQNSLENKKNERENVEQAVNKIISQIRKIKKHNEEHELERRLFNRFRSFANDVHNGSDYTLSLPMQKILDSRMEKCHGKIEEKGLSVSGNFIATHNFIMQDILEFISNLEMSQGVSVNSSQDNLEARIKICRQEMTDAYERGDEDVANRKKNELNELKKVRDTPGKTGIPQKIRETCDETLLQLCENDRQKAIEVFRKIKDEWCSFVQETLEEMESALESFIEDDVEELENQRNSLEGKLTTLGEEILQLQDKLQAKEKGMNSIKGKWGCGDENLQDTLNSHLQKFENEAESLADIRTVFAPALEEFKRRLKDENAADYDKDHLLPEYIKSCNVVGMSCTANMRLLHDEGFDTFDVVIIDEVSKATPPELLIPMMKGKKVILVGDHRQLPPLFEEHERSYKEIVDDLQDDDESDLKEILTHENFRKYKNMVTASLFKSYFENADESIKHPLLTQYRMHSNIMGVINRFYEGRLKCGYDKEAEEKEKAHNLTIKGVDGLTFIRPNKHVYWLDSSTLPSGKDVYETFYEGSTSACNILEQYLIIELVKKIAMEYKSMGYTKKRKVSVGIISFYQRQVNDIRRMIRELEQSKEYKENLQVLDISVNTVDRFQGKEKNIVITSLVRNNKSGRASKHVVAYERINVAFSRAQNLLFIVAAERFYKGLEVTLPRMDAEGENTFETYKAILEELKRDGCFAGSSKLISTELAEEILDKYKALKG